MLGSSEKLFIVLNSIASKSFALVAELEGKLTGEDLRKGIDAVQNRHPLLKARIVRDENKTYFFEMGMEHQIEISELEVSDASKWKAFLEREISVPFDLSLSPLFRVYLLRSEKTFSLIFIIHHSIGDGQSAVNIFQDLLSHLAGKKLARLENYKSMDELLGIEDREYVVGNQNINIPLSESQAKAAEGERFFMATCRLSEGQTEQLIAACRQHGTTVNGLLNAAMCMSIWNAHEDGATQILSLRSPASVREALGIGKEFGLYINTKPTSVSYSPNMDIWQLARIINSDLVGITSPQTIIDTLKRFRGLLFKPLDIVDFAEIFRSAPQIDLMVTNLGLVKLDLEKTDLKVNALWGPIVLGGDGSEQTVGALSTNGKLHLVNSSLKPIAEILQRCTDVILQAIGME